MSGDRVFVSLLYDLRYALRSLGRSPLFTIVAVLTLAIGVGATTAVFSVVNSVLLEPLPYPHADELVSIRHVAPGAPGLVDVSGGLRPSPSMYFTYADENRSFENLGLWNVGTANVTGLAEPEEVRTIGITDSVLQALAVPPSLGRWFDASDQAPGAPRTVMLTYDYWQRRFGGDEAAIGHDIRVNELPRQIVGVMPRGFRVADADADLLLPAGIDRSQLIPPPFCCQIVARLRDGMTIEEANADVARMLPIWMDSWPFRDGRSARSYEAWQIAPALRSLKADVVGDIGNVLWIVLAMIGFVLVIACTNVANLLLVRADARQRELAVRAALGAGSWRIGRVVLLESTLLGLAAGVLGIVVGYAILDLLVTLGPSNLPRLDEISLDARALAVALSVALFSGLALGLLVSSGLMMRTFQALRTVEPGFTQAEQLQTVRITIPSQLEPDPQRVAQMQNDTVDAVAAVPGVTSAAFTSAMPLEMRGNNWDGIEVEGRDPPHGDGARAMRIFKYVSPGLMTTAGTRLVAGRDFTWTDVHDLRPVAMVSENLARELWEEPAAALGERIRVGGPDTPWREVAIRLALGAQRRALRRSFVGYGLALAGIGVAVGLVGAGAVTRLMASLLYEVRPLDWPTYASVAVLLTVAAVVASYLPARKASNVPPAEALAAD